MTFQFSIASNVPKVTLVSLHSPFHNLKKWESSWSMYSNMHIFNQEHKQCKYKYINMTNKTGEAKNLIPATFRFINGQKPYTLKHPKLNEIEISPTLYLLTR